MFICLTRSFAFCLLRAIEEEGFIFFEFSSLSFNFCRMLSFPDFEILQFLQEGGGGEVWETSHKKKKKTQAINTSNLKALAPPCGTLLCSVVYFLVHKAPYK